MLMFPMRMLGIALGMAQRAVASANRVFELLDRAPRIEPPHEPQRLPAGGGRISFDHVTLSYGDERPALVDVTLEVAPGETVAIVGPTGSGKTTLVAAVGRLYDVSEGAVRVDGVDVRDLDPSELRHAISLVPDDGFLFSATVRDNIAYARPEASFEEVVTAAQRAQIHEFIQGLPDGYDTLVGERGLTLSGGQRQRIAIARAIVTDPRVLILDDATASVDAATEREIKFALREVMAGSHDPRDRASPFDDRARRPRDRDGVRAGHSAGLARGAAGRQRAVRRDRGQGDAAAGRRAQRPRQRGAGRGRARSGADRALMKLIPRPTAGSSGRERRRRLRGVAELLRPYRFRVIVAFVSLVLATAASLAPPTSRSSRSTRASRRATSVR